MNQPITGRRLQVVQLAAHGYTNTEIAHRMYLSPETIKTHLQTAYRQLGARDRTHAVALAIRAGLINPHTIQPTRRTR
jgi:DNA-binding NarL/FixJ family response regulator